MTALLDGHGGDEVVWHGRQAMQSLATAKRWLQLWRALRAYEFNTDVSSFALAWTLTKAMTRQGNIGPALGWVSRRLARKRTVDATGGGGAIARPAPASEDNGDIAPRLSQEDRGTVGAPVPGSREDHWRALTSPAQSYAFGVLNRAGAHWGIECRFPFWDRRLVEFCLTLPDEEKFRDGFSRSILRRAMQGILPSEVQWRRGKLNFGPAFVKNLLRFHGAEIEAALADRSGPIEAYVDFDAAHAIFARVKAASQTASGADAQAIWRFAVLARWLAVPAADRLRVDHGAGAAMAGVGRC